VGEPARSEAVAERAQRARDELARARARREDVSQRLRQAEAHVGELTEQFAAARARLSSLEAVESRRRAEQEARASLRARIQAELEDTRVAQHTREQRVELLDRQAAELAERESALVEEARTGQLELAPLEEQLATAERARLQIVERRRGLEQRLADLRAAERAAHAGREERLLATQRALTELELIEQEISAAAELSEHEPAWVVQLKLEAAPEDEIDLDAARRRILTLQRELRALGGVADSVVDEYRDLSERHDFLLAQAGDLRQAMAELQTAAEELEASMRERFAEVFAATQRSFEQCFKRLFGGGEAQLILTDPADPLRGGIDIVARPPGKKLQNLLTLSGGERALTVVALLFGLLDVNPTPFCLLDEVDAALDESNVQRFADLLTDFSSIRQIQFIVVTHNRATMDKADALYGVSMDAQGVSRLFSVQPRELAHA
jgi:chromosome segregation protein